MHTVPYKFCPYLCRDFPPAMLADLLSYRLCLFSTLAMGRTNGTPPVFHDLDTIWVWMGVFNKQKKNKFRIRKLPVSKENATNSNVCMNLYPNSFHIIRSVRTTRKVSQIELNLIPAGRKSWCLEEATSRLLVHKFPHRMKFFCIIIIYPKASLYKMALLSLYFGN